MRAEAWSVGSTASRKHCAGMSGDMLVCFTSPALLRIVRHSMLQPASQQSGSEQSCRPRAGPVQVSCPSVPLAFQRLCSVVSVEGTVCWNPLQRDAIGSRDAASGIGPKFTTMPSY